MRLFIRIVIFLAIVSIGVLLSGYGVLMGSQKTVGGLGLQCKYLTAQGFSTAFYLHGDNGLVGRPSCPLLRKSTSVVDQG
ncbi:MAG: YobH family protein [Kluyvera sp.]